MKISVTLVIFVILGSVLVGSSYAKIASREDPSLPLVSLQIQVRNSDGQLGHTSSQHLCIFETLVGYMNI